MVKGYSRPGWRDEIFFEVIQLHNGSGWNIQTTSGDYEADFLINCAGLHCDRVSRMAGNHDPARIVPFRGEYYNYETTDSIWCETLSILCPIQSSHFSVCISPA